MVKKIKQNFGQFYGEKWLKMDRKNAKNIKTGKEWKKI